MTSIRGRKIEDVANDKATSRLSIFQPVIQYGFAGMAVVLLMFIGWMLHANEQRFNKLLDLQRETNQVIERNTAAIQELSRVVHDKL